MTLYVQEKYWAHSCTLCIICSAKATKVVQYVSGECLCEYIHACDLHIHKVQPYVHACIRYYAYDCTLCMYMYTYGCTLCLCKSCAYGCTCIYSHINSSYVHVQPEWISAACNNPIRSCRPDMFPL